MNIHEKIYNRIATLADQEEALKDPQSAYYFACLNIPGTDIEKCFQATCNISNCLFASILPRLAYQFAVNVTGADIKYCQKSITKNGKNKQLLIKLNKQLKLSNRTL